MNPVTFNKNYDLMTEGATEGSPERMLAKSPLLVWRDDTGDHFEFNDHPGAFYETGCPRLPFRQFRVDGFYAGRMRSGIKFKAWISENDIPDSGYMVALEIQEIIEDANVIERPKNIFLGKVGINGDDIRGTWEAVNPKTRIVSTIKNPPGAQFRGLFFEWVTKLCIDFQNPHFHLCRKTAADGGAVRSTQWRQAREHYVLLHKSHAANNREATGRRIIDGDTVERSAHSRRAHYRMLSSPKFRHKRGQRVWVASAWAGPKEWTDRSGQIYRIVDKPTAEPAKQAA